MLIGVGLVYKKIIVRRKNYTTGVFCLRTLLFSEYSTVDDFRKAVGDRRIMKEIYEEEIDSDVLEQSNLFHMYSKALASGEDNDYFCFMYQVKDDLAVRIDTHVYMHHIYNDLKIGDQQIVPWECTDSKVFASETWYYTDEEILNDMTNMSFVDFLKQYKGY